MKEASQPRKTRDTFLAGFYVTTKHVWELPPHSPQLEKQVLFKCPIKGHGG